MVLGQGMTRIGSTSGGDEVKEDVCDKRRTPIVKPCVERWVTYYCD